jgi:hypothetical protein
MGIMLRMRALPAGFIAPCLPTKTDKLPTTLTVVQKIALTAIVDQAHNSN